MLGFLLLAMTELLALGFIGTSHGNKPWMKLKWILLNKRSQFEKDYNYMTFLIRQNYRHHKNITGFEGLWGGDRVK